MTVAAAPSGPRWGFLLLGWAMAGLALAGAVLPLLPATPFALVAAWAFARSSPRLEAWLQAHPRLGPALRDWRARRAVPPRAKVLAVASMVASWLMLLALGAATMVLAVVGLIMLTAGGWLVSRPS